MAFLNKSGSRAEGMVRRRSFKWVSWRRGWVNDDSGDTETGDALVAGKSWITELSPFANVVVRRCSKTLAFWISAKLNHLSDKNFRLLTYDMIVAWDTPTAFSPPLLNVGHDVTVGKEAFSRLAPPISLVANVIISENLYEVLSVYKGGQLQFPVYEKYLLALERPRRRLKCRSDSSLLSAMRLSRGENVLEVDRTIISQPVLEHDLEHVKLLSALNELEKLKPEVQQRIENSN